ncbi:class I adenylate-forming enzyme family protein [Gordonia sp. L191]|uniref:class I adenylate-forming enzyme family protein n=1 Tax=Gordonia sp. L191 TaxID=2982699 RepID=UPI0024C0AC38|nr:class I adenylate-forming enzyme family protein [Gordonia sp. L191]WHU47450.1 class I adenylate-forming enzyme family protein [Gordonia sp. L191]
MTSTETPGLRSESRWEKDTSIDLDESTIGAVLVRRAHDHPTVVALIATAHDGSAVRLTYSELLDESRRVATRLRQLVAPGQMIALWAPNVAEWPIIQYGAALAGVVLVAVNPALRPPELEYVLRHSGATVLIHADRGRDYDMAAVAEEVAATVGDVRTVSLSDRDRWRGTDSAPDVEAESRISPDDVAMLQYTSGTTGNPKGVLLRHRSLINVARLTMREARMPDHLTAVNPLPMFHTAACVIGTLGPLSAAGTMILVKQFAPGPVIDVMRSESANVLFFVPAVLSALVEYVRSTGDRAPELRVMLGGAATIAATLIESAEATFGGRLVNVYGQTELAPVLTATRPDDSREDKLRTVGRPLPQVECTVVDPVTREIVPVGVVGEICARGYQQFVAYHDDPEATARAVDGAGFVHTGDLGSMDSRGYLTITGRLKELIIRGGENIAPAEVESRILEVDGVVEVAVVGLPDARLGETVAAVLRLRDTSVDPSDVSQQVQAHLVTCLTPFKIPARWFIADALPVTPTGKVRKFAIVEAIASRALAEI